ncbi:MAG: YceH family protein [Planctomycetota bacterium]|nr:YceH family protein [Planctomycetota bacterium]
MDELNAHEARVLGVLIEKAYTTPDQYPLSLNGATNGCNQKSNRHPVTDFSEAEVTVALTGLKFKHLVGATTPAGSRVEKYRHNALEHFKLDAQSVAVLAELLLRGPQSKGELRPRASRMRKIDSLEELQQVLDKLMETGYARRHPPAPGSRAERFGHCLSNDPTPAAGEASPAASRASAASGASVSHATSAPLPASTGGGLESRVTQLEAEVERLRGHLVRLAEQLGETLE